MDIVSYTAQLNLECANCSKEENQWEISAVAVCKFTLIEQVP